MALIDDACRLELLGLSMRLPPQLIVHSTEAQIAQHEAVYRDHDGRLTDGDWRFISAPDGLEPWLAGRGCSLDTVALRPDGTLIDPCGGLADLKRGRLRLLGSSPLSRDPALLVRVLALASALELRLDEALLLELEEARGKVLSAPRPAIRDALTRIIMCRRPARGLTLLARVGLLPLVLPEVSALVDFHKTSRMHHKDLWRHTCTVVEQAIPRFHIRWSALLHDIAKVHTRTFGPGRKVHFFHHEALGAQLFEGIARRLNFAPDTAEQIRFLIHHHQRCGLYTSKWTDAAVRRFDVEMGDALPSLMHLSRADCTTSRPEKRRKAVRSLHALRLRIEALRRADQAKISRLPKGLGGAIMMTLGVPPGREIGRLRAACEAAVRDGRLDDSPSVEACISFLKASG